MVERPLNASDIEVRLAKVERTLDRQTPWYRTAATVISALALFVSLSTGGFNVYMGCGSAKWTRRQQLTETIAKLTELAEAAAKLESVDLNSVAKKNAGIALTNRQMILLSGADRLVRELEGDVRPTELAVLGVGYAFTGDFDRAESYF